MIRNREHYQEIKKIRDEPPKIPLKDSNFRKSLDRVISKTEIYIRRERMRIYRTLIREMKALKRRQKWQITIISYNNKEKPLKTNILNATSSILHQEPKHRVSKSRDNITDLGSLELKLCSLRPLKESYRSFQSLFWRRTQSC